MDFKKLFETQAALDASIIEKHPVAEGENRLADKVLALQVELAECANEWRGFKFWSNDQQPRTKIEHLCVSCDGKGYREFIDPFNDESLGKDICETCEGNPILNTSNPLLEEYVDVLHFALSIGLEIGVTMDKVYLLEKSAKTITERFTSLAVGWGILGMQLHFVKESYEQLFAGTIRLGLKLGFTLDEIEAAYYSKNKINHERQAVGY